jgi:protein NRD1
LTEADLKWVVTAEYGGTGGRELEAGMTLEEPDIEIGAGVSSKAISQKIHLRGNQEGGRGHQEGSRGRGRGRGRGEQREGWRQQEEVFSPGAGVPASGGFPGFPMMPGQQGMFPQGQFPPFMMPPQMQAFFQQQFGSGPGQPGQDGFQFMGGQGQQGQGQEGFQSGFTEQQGEEGQLQ